MTYLKSEISCLPSEISLSVKSESSSSTAYRIRRFAMVRIWDIRRRYPCENSSRRDTARCRYTLQTLFEGYPMFRFVFVQQSLPFLSFSYPPILFWNSAKTHFRIPQYAKNGYSVHNPWGNAHGATVFLPGSLAHFSKETSEKISHRHNSSFFSLYSQILYLSMDCNIFINSIFIFIFIFVKTCCLIGLFASYWN